MNRFLRRKEKEDDSPKSPTSSSFTFGKSKKNKKQQPEPELKLDVGTALPSSDEFRTSLIMPNLSARFSMLREQDDPKSKLGKASDDSVLQPKRQSRLNEFGFKGSALADIDEVSINGSFRPPFARERQGSFDSFRTDLEEADSGSMMSRARPGEGNILFGGRQKVYRIGGNVKGMGKALYEDDVGLSTFQRLKRQDKEEQERRDAEFTAGNFHHSDISIKRETSSSTNSTPSNTRISTAATSIASQGANSITTSSPSIGPNRSPIEPNAGSGVERSGTKSRRLYEQGLDQHIHDQQASTMSRLNTVHMHRGGNGNSGRTSPPQLGLAKSASNLGERYNRPTHPFRTASPPPVATYTNFAALYGSREGKTNTGGEEAKAAQAQSSIMSPVSSQHEELSSAISPSDRGKATALGTFNKPSAAFDEQQYLQRQMQMHKGREVQQPSRDASYQGNGDSYAPVDSEDKNQSRTRSPSNQSTAPSPFSVFQNAASQMKSPTSQNAPDNEGPYSQHSTAGAQRSFIHSPEESEDEYATSRRQRQPNRDFASIPRPEPSPSIVAPPLSEHPALRLQRPEQDAHAQDHTNTTTTGLASDRYVQEDDKDGCIDSPTLPQPGGGLSGLVRQHLRNVSNVSSVYTDGADSTNGTPAASRLSAEQIKARNQVHSEADVTNYSTHSHSNPWDLEDVDRSFYGDLESRSSLSNSVNTNAKSANDAVARTNSEREARAMEIQKDAEARRAAWESDMVTKHSRQPSAEERDAFQRELQVRQRAVIERMQAVQAEEENQTFTRKAFGMLRSKSSRDSMAYGHQGTRAQLKPLSNYTLSSSSTSLNQSGNTQNRNYSSGGPKSSDDFAADARSRSQSRPRQPPPKSSSEWRDLEFRQYAPSGSRDHSRAPPSRSPPGSSSNHIQGPQMRARPESSKGSDRDRSNSDLSSGRSRSRSTRGTSAYDATSADMSEAHYPPIPSHNGSVQHLHEGGRQRNGSDSSSNLGYDAASRNLSPLQVPSPVMGRPSPAGTSPGFSQMFPPSPRPSPGPNASDGFLPRPNYAQANYSNHSTPPVSNVNTPTASNFASTQGPLANMMANRPPIRRKTVNKQDISDPVLVSSTSSQETVDLPPGASLRNGSITAPPLPVMNPKRRFGFGRSQPQSPVDSASGDEFEAFRQQQERPGRKTSDPTARPVISGPVPSNGSMF